MQTAAKILLLLTIFIYFQSCSKSNTSNSSNQTVDYSGKYHGTVSHKMTSGGSTTTQTYDMTIDISKGDSAQELKILFGSWLTLATQNGTKFTIQQTSFSGPIVTTGSGEFISATELNINYNQVIGGTGINNLNGKLTKF